MNVAIKALLIFTIIFSSAAVSAQVSGDLSDPISQIKEKLDFSDAVLLVVNGIKPEAFKRKFDMNEWLDKWPGVKTTVVPEMKESLNTLVRNFKNSSFEKDAKSGIMKSVIGLNGKKDIPNVLSTLVNGLKSNLLTESFLAKKDDFLEELKVMK